MEEGSHLGYACFGDYGEMIRFPLYIRLMEAEAAARAGAHQATIYPYGPFPVQMIHTVMSVCRTNVSRWVLARGSYTRQPSTMASMSDMLQIIASKQNRERTLIYRAKRDKLIA